MDKRFKRDLITAAIMVWIVFIVSFGFAQWLLSLGERYAS